MDKRGGDYCIILKLIPEWFCNNEALKTKVATGEHLVFAQVVIKLDGHFLCILTEMAEMNAIYCSQLRIYLKIYITVTSKKLT